MTLGECERRELPEDIRSFTFRGRYDHVNQRLIELAQLAALPPKTKIRVLDVGCGVLHFGSPTLHDLWDALAAHRIEPVIVGVDPNIPPALKPSYRKIRYRSTMGKTRGTFDIVRMLHVIEHVAPHEYEELRNEALRRLRDGGLFIVSQQIARWKRDSRGEYPRLMDPVTKIAQRRGWGMEPVDLLPDVRLPAQCGFGFLLDPEQHALQYQEFRERLRNGLETMPITINERGFAAALRVLEDASWKALDHELFGSQDTGVLYGSTNRGRWSRQDMELSARETASRFHRKYKTTT
ncbi:MAG: methyltransferase domain-containing protein [bacterium]|nr:methyltransferase domain-containing protein [bacterium]